MQSWVSVYDSRQYDILLTSYSEIVRGEIEYVHKILDFYCIPRARFVRPTVEKTIPESHFRVGWENEWMTSFSDDQISRATAMIGDDLLSRFYWPLAKT
jgi:hypothetical protein